MKTRNFISLLILGIAVLLAGCDEKKVIPVPPRHEPLVVVDYANGAAISNAVVVASASSGVHDWFRPSWAWWPTGHAVNNKGGIFRADALGRADLPPEYWAEEIIYISAFQIGYEETTGWAYKNERWFTLGSTVRLKVPRHMTYFDFRPAPTNNVQLPFSRPATHDSATNVIRLLRAGSSPEAANRYLCSIQHAMKDFKIAPPPPDIASWQQALKDAEASRAAFGEFDIGNQGRGPLKFRVVDGKTGRPIQHFYVYGVACRRISGIDGRIREEPEPDAGWITASPAGGFFESDSNGVATLPAEMTAYAGAQGILMADMPPPYSACLWRSGARVIAPRLPATDPLGWMTLRASCATNTEPPDDRHIPPSVFMGNWTEERNRLNHYLQIIRISKTQYGLELTNKIEDLIRRKEEWSRPSGVLAGNQPVQRKANRSLNDLTFSADLTKAQVIAKWGLEDAARGSGVAYYEYLLGDGRKVWVAFNSDPSNTLSVALVFEPASTKSKVIFPVMSK